ncbi:hypothetical protein B0T18DRAFT_158828 [Schizothecium vesticola]|uniref:Uncharacterized protein n=1 Tax=Schizothecium vesticola TaxID=314040 RepID=A0AA40K5K7_9PEZI|nr:hypothetical protein B0T18DRAFT_158828 [Schizothecium vesticola]
MKVIQEHHIRSHRTTQTHGQQPTPPINNRATTPNIQIATSTTPPPISSPPQCPSTTTSVEHLRTPPHQPTQHPPPPHTHKHHFLLVLFPHKHPHPPRLIVGVRCRARGRTLTAPAPALMTTVFNLRVTADTGTGTGAAVRDPWARRQGRGGADGTRGAEFGWISVSLFLCGGGGVGPGGDGVLCAGVVGVGNPRARRLGRGRADWARGAEFSLLSPVV